MSRAIYRKTHRYLAFAEAWEENTGRPPTVAQIANGVGVLHTSAEQVIANLTDIGLLKRGTIAQRDKAGPAIVQAYSVTPAGISVLDGKSP